MTKPHVPLLADTMVFKETRQWTYTRGSVVDIITNNKTYCIWCDADGSAEVCDTSARRAADKSLMLMHTHNDEQD